MVLYMNRRIRDLKLSNAVTVLSDPDNPLLPDKAIARFFICSTWHHVEKKTKYLSLTEKNGQAGRPVIILDYKNEALPVGPSRNEDCENRCCEPV
jgi:hypothetical protein